MKTRVLIQATLVALSVIFLSCQDDDEVKPISIITDIEIGLYNSEIGTIGEDLHFNAEVLAGDLIDTVRVKIQPREGETYPSDWSFEIKWDQYKGTKNATVHKHFDIPEDAVEGTYDFIVIVEDENGTVTEEVRTISIYLAENLPVNPTLVALKIYIYPGGDVYELDEGGFVYDEVEDPTILYKDKYFNCQARIGQVKGDGIMYLLLIKKSAEHHPETVDEIDFSKVIVYDVYQHENKEESSSFSNFVAEVIDDVPTVTRNIPYLIIGAEEDNNVPASPITGDIAWESGDYYFAVIYKNTTYNMGVYHYIDFTVSMD